VDAIWIENMNTVLDDNMMLCLSNGERVKLNNTMRMLFEVADLNVASPATVSRVGIVWVPDDSVGWETYIKPFLENTLDKNLFKPELLEFTVNEFMQHCGRCIKWMKKNSHEPIETGEMQQI
jgi:dynein heavy chain